MSDTHASSERRRPWAGWAVVLLTLLVVVADLEGARDLRQARATAAGLERRIAAAEERIAELGRTREQLVAAEPTLERLAREELLMVKPGDVVILLPREDGERPASPVVEATPSDGTPAGEGS